MHNGCFHAGLFQVAFCKGENPFADVSRSHPSKCTPGWCAKITALTAYRTSIVQRSTRLSCEGSKWGMRSAARIMREAASQQGTQQSGNRRSSSPHSSQYASSQPSHCSNAILMKAEARSSAHQYMQAKMQLDWVHGLSTLARVTSKVRRAG